MYRICVDGQFIAGASRQSVNRQFQYQAIVRRKGFKVASGTFESKRDAQDWAATIEPEMRRGIFIDRSEAESMTLRELLMRCSEELLANARMARLLNLREPAFGPVRRAPAGE